MTCEFDKGLLAAHYDGETTAEERAQVERHLAGCPECARDLAAMKGLSAALKPLAKGSAPMSIAEGVMREIRPAAAPRRWVSWTVSAAAALLFAVGTVMILNRERSGEPVHTFARESAAEKELSHRRDDGRSKYATKVPLTRSAPAGDRAAGAAHPELKKVEEKTPPAASLPPPAPSEEPAREEDRSKDEKSDLAEQAQEFMRKPDEPKKAPEVPVVRVTSADVAAARAAVEAFLAERKVKWTPGASLLGKGDFVQAHYFQLDLTEEESAALQKRLADLKETALASGSLDDEKKRVAKEIAKEDAAKKSKALSAPATDAVAGAKTDKDAEGEKLSRGRTANLSPEAAVRRKIIFVFEPLPKK